MTSLTMLVSCLLGMAISAQAALVAILDYEKSHGSKGVIETLHQDGEHEVKVIPEITAEHLRGADVLIISHMYNLDLRDVVREFVRHGGGVLMTHDAAGSGRPFSGSQSHGKAESTFPEISHTPESGTMVSSPQVKAIRRHPITEGMGDVAFKHIFSDHAILFPVDDRMVLMEDRETEDGFGKNRFRGTQVRWDAYLGGNAVLIAAPFGEGRVVLCAMLLGLSSEYKPLLNKAEQTLVLNSVNWLAGITPLGVPKTLEPSTPSKYAPPSLPKAPTCREEAVFVETQVVASRADSGGARRLRFQLPNSISPGRSVPVVMDVPAGSVPRTVCVVQADGDLGDSVPVQIEKGDGGRNQLVFIESFPARAATLVFDSGETSDAAGLQVKVSAEGSLAEITGPHFSLLVGCEGDEPTIQCARVLDWDWHHTWDGLERNNLSAPILRLAKSLWPFKATRPSMDHEVGLPFPGVASAAAQTSRFPVRVTLRVGNGRLTVYRTGQVHLENFARQGRIATFLIDRYLSDGQEIPETVSYDLPAVQGKWVWALRDYRYALGGTFHALEKMGETGLAPGMERKVLLSGDTLVLTTDVKHLDRYQVAAVPCSVQTTDLPSGKQAGRAESQTPLTYPTIKVSQRRLWKMRGTDEFFEILAEPIEIYGDLLNQTPTVTRWEMRGDDEVMIGASMTGAFGNSVEDPLVIEAMKKGDPHREDAGVWRRFYLRCEEVTDLKATRLTLRGTNKNGETVVMVPVEIHQAVSLPVGIFTYGPGWAQYWHWAGKHNGRCPPDQWAPVLRNIAMSGLDYIIHIDNENEPESPAEIQSRLKRYGLWWMVSLMQAYRGVNSLRNLNQEGKERIEQFYSERMPRWKDAPNIIAWYLSDEIPNGVCENGILNGSYRTVALLYDLCRKYDGTRPAINLLTPHATPYETSTRYLPSDAFSWDPYGLGAEGAYETAATVDTMWRKTKNKPSWITLRSCGPGWIDCLDLWLDIRRRSLGSFRGNVDGINYFTYSHWATDMESHAWYAVIPGTKGAIATPRWQALNQIVRDIELLATAEYLLDRCRGPEKELLAQQMDEAKWAGQEGEFYKMRTLLNAILRKARQK